VQANCIAADLADNADREKRVAKLANEPEENAARLACALSGLFQEHSTLRSGQTLERVGAERQKPKIRVFRVDSRLI